MCRDSKDGNSSCEVINELDFEKCPPGPLKSAFGLIDMTDMTHLPVHRTTTMPPTNLPVITEELLLARLSPEQFARFQPPKNEPNEYNAYFALKISHNEVHISDIFTNVHFL